MNDQRVIPYQLLTIRTRKIANRFLAVKKFRRPKGLRQRRKLQRAASAEGASAAKQQAPKARAQQSSKRQRRERSKAASAKGASTNRKRESAPSKFAQRTPSKAQRAAKQAPEGAPSAIFAHENCAEELA
ncbi:hypothetical protein CWE23_04260 [Idiomarina aquatica]|uniref:Uncharacterized protein n=1 Tax=Idiomarina aquatica TaxID=1327752 RepID=A0AA94EG39_9GAMM|nr:hypothetical protein CWE23_04260 [Idiomarina aquatica]